MEDQDYILFDNYISGELTEDAKMAFENRLRTDAAFKKSYETYQEATHFLAQKFEHEEATVAFKENLQKIGDTHFKETPTSKKVRSFTFLKYAVAASIILMMGIFLFDQNTSPSYEDFITYDTLSLTVRGGETNATQKAEEAFNTKNFKVAEGYLNTLLEADADNQELLLYKGITLLEQDKLEEATALFEKIQHGNSVFKNKASWYLALTHLKAEKFAECKASLESIPEDAESYAQAQKLLEALE
ncbi:hypothetical protein [Ascidiimonas sp. W6]|uniref:hypothetical protein n=1 Tax=Ascidiimonas meishanensis TaxID=3128903 RepID=UPI0030EB4A29